MQVDPTKGADVRSTSLKENIKCAMGDRQQFTSPSNSVKSGPFQIVSSNQPMSTNASRRARIQKGDASRILEQSPPVKLPPLSSNPGIPQTTPFFSSSLAYSNIRTTPPSRGQWTTNSVLRSGESMEMLFGIDESSTEEFRRLCRSIVNGVEDNARTWKRALEIASKEAMLSESKGTMLIRLHRRATSRLTGTPSDQASIVSSIWLSYAQALARHGPEKDARVMFCYIQNQRLCERDASLYIALAELERKSGNIAASKTALKQGIDKRAQPLHLIQDKLSEIVDADSTSISASRKRSHPQDVSPKRQRTESKFGKTNPPVDKKAEKESIRFQLMPLSQNSANYDARNSTPPKSNAKRNVGSTPTESDAVVLTSETSSFRSEEKTPQHLPNAERQKLRAAGLFSTSRSSRPPLILKTPLLSKVPLLSRGSLGKPERVNPSNTSLTTDDTDDDDERDLQEMEANKASDSVGKAVPAKKPKLTKLDLGYMWAWDPSKPRQDSKKAEENNDQSNTSDCSTKEQFSGDSNVSFIGSTPSKSNSSAGALQKQSDQKYPEERQRDIADDKSNSQFLPLVSESNMIRVNKTPYAKLGVIGRGGSCKVYRALSTKCSVVAIKKVRLDGMDQKAIDGYANEIALLRRLRGNPSIIQLFDSQIDTTRKSILLVMEVGEVDLNHVLQQQEALAASKRGRQLNLNFIRLTWQQMLTAVHAIHEERIIHGDLKPANFLFVRGALKLIDFGIAKAIQGDDTTNIYRESQIGTLNYMSPEAILDTGSSDDGLRMKLGRASDIWSLGCILYQMVYGKTPFAALSMIPKLQAIVNPNHRIKYPGEMDRNAVDAIQRCLKRSPSERATILGEDGLLNHHRFLNS